MKVKGRITEVNLDYLTHQPKITFQLKNQADILNDIFTSLQKESELDIEFKKHRERRGNDANAYFHVLINQLARHYEVSDDEMKIKMNLQYGTIARDKNDKVLGAKVPISTNMQDFYKYSKWYKKDKDCDCYLFYKRTSELDSKEFSSLIKGVESECKDVGIETLDDIKFEAMMKEYEKEEN